MHASLGLSSTADHPSHVHGTSVSSESAKSDQTKNPDITDVYLAFVRTRGLRFIELFKILSKDRDGHKLSKEDFVGGMKKLNAPIHDFKLRELFDKMDTSGNGAIAFQEFVLWTRERYQATGRGFQQ